MTATPVVAASEELPSGADVVVVGGGVIGAACTHALVESGIATVLIEAGEFGSGASGACEGNVLVSDKSPGPEFDLARRSVELYGELEERLGADIQRELKGSLLVAPDEETAAMLEREAEWMEREGLGIERLDRTAVIETEPVVDPGIASGLFVADDLQVCPMHLVSAYVAASKRLGATVVRGCEVEAIEVESGRVTGLATNLGPIDCTTVVVAAGLGSGPLVKSAGESLSVTGRRGQILVGAPMPGLIRHKLYDFGYRTTVREHQEDSVQIATVLECTRRGNVLIGASREFRDTSAEPDPAVDAALARHALRLAPGLAGLKILRSYAGVRPTLPDGLPAIGTFDSTEGLLVATGHEGAGIGLAPGTAEMIAAQVAGREAPVAPEAFRPDRPALSSGVKVGGRVA